VARHLGVDEDGLTPDVRLTGDLAVDSLDLLDLAVGLEGAFDVSLDSVAERRLLGVETVGDLVRTVEGVVRERRAAQAASHAARSLGGALVRIVPARRRTRAGWRERVAWLTPYTADQVLHDVVSCGRGTRLDVRLPPNVPERVRARLAAELRWLDACAIAVEVRRDPTLPPA
jgi:acyl carrier protein